MIPVDQIKKVLIIRPDSIADMILTLPCIRAIKAQYPHWYVAVLASPYNAQIIRHIPEIDEIILDWKKDNKIHSFKDRLAYIRYLRRQQFDLAIHFYSDTDTVWTCFLAGIPRTIGDTAKIGRWPFFRKHGGFLKIFDQTKHVVEYNFQLLKSIGITLNPNQPLELPVPDDYKIRGNRLLDDAGRRNSVPLVGIQIGVGFGNRALEPEKYADYINLLRTEVDVDVCITPYSEKEKVFAARFINNLTAPAFTLPDNTITDFMGIISHYDLFVSVDTGPCHMSTAMGTPILAIFPSRRVKPTRWAPWRTRHFIVRESQTCPHFCPHQGCVLTVCSDAIQIRDMVDKTKALLLGGGLQTPTEQFKEWFAKSMSILILDSPDTTIQAVEFEAMLKKENVRVLRKPITTSKLAPVLLENDITIIHNFSGKKKFRVSIIARIMSLKLFTPALIINSPWTIDPLIAIENRYRAAFEGKLF